MNTRKHRLARRLPEFLPLEQIAPGQPFNPFDCLTGFQARRAMLSHPKLSAGAKNLWVLLADECYGSGYDSQTQGSLASKLAVTTRQLRRYLAQLKRHHLVHVEPELGRQDYHWLLYHPIFAGCSPRTQDKDVLGDRTFMSGGSGQGCPPQRNYQRNYQRSDGATRLKATSGSVPVEQNGRRFGEDPQPRESTPPDFRYRRVRPLPEPPSERTHNPLSSDAGNGESLVVVREARAFWYALEPGAKRNRYEQAVNVADRIHHFRNYLKDPHAEIARQAQHEISRALDELRGLGFSLHSNGKATR